MNKKRIKSLYYITHIGNIPSILQRGILSHEIVHSQNLEYQAIYDSQIVSNRQTKTAPNGKSLWEFANLFFQARNPMLYRVIHERSKHDIAILGVDPGVIDTPGAFITTGNAASTFTKIYGSDDGIDAILGMWDIITSDWWKEEDGSKRKIMAECLVPDSISPDRIHSIFVSGHTAARKVNIILPSSAKVEVVPEPHMFFQPRRRFMLSPTLFLVDGDMFFSQMQTLTISVNTVGVMGKGLASRTKYQFPDVYVYYQDLCRQKTLKMGKPYLYKRESYLDRELADDPFTLPDINANKWFLLFPTKGHWREKSDLDGIATGLDWVVDNHKTLGIESLAIPALGCGLGQLDWKDAGPTMSQALAKLDIQAAIYLPREQNIPDELLTPDFLLGEG